MESTAGAKAERPRRHSTSSIGSNMINERGKDADVWKYYKEKHLLGQGSMGNVTLVKRKKGTEGGSAYPDASPASDRGSRGLRGALRKMVRPKKSKPATPGDATTHGNEYALKSIHFLRVEKVFRDELRNEIEILKSLDHPNIVKAYEVYENPYNMWLVMEYCSGGDLFARAPYSENQAAAVVSQICSAISYMHQKRMVHRDLKMENIMFESREPTAKIRVIDFGLSKKVNPSASLVLNGCVGTMYTMSPQELDGKYDFKADCWAIGVLAYLMLCHETPFKGKKDEMKRNIRRCQYDFKGHKASEEARDFVASLLVVDLKERSSAAVAVQHPWVKGPRRSATDADAKVLQDLVGSAKENILSFAKTNKLQKVAAAVVAHKSSFAEIADMRQAFENFDRDKDGVVSVEEFIAALSEFDYTEEEMNDMFNQMDLNRNGVLDYTEFLAATLQMNGRLEEIRLAEAFDHIDEDNSGSISKEELVKFLGEDAATIEKVMKEGDTDGDGMISFDEFLVMFRSNYASAAKEQLSHSASTDHLDRLTC